MSNWQSTYEYSINPPGKLHAAGGSNPVNSGPSQYLDDQYPDSLGADVLSIALIGPDTDRRKAAASALAGCQSGEVREFSSYPPSLDDVPRLLEQHYDVIIIDLDAQPEYALELVESICANGAATVMVYSMKTDSELLVRCMRAGAREFLTLPFAQNTMAEALVRASARRPAPRAPKKTGGRLLAFLGAKGGDGVTTLASNFAVSLAQESSESTLLIDLNLPLGDAALNLGITAEYSTINALQNASRLDSSFLSKLLVKHDSGVSVLAAPGKFPTFDATDEAVDRLIAVARQDFDNVVIDMGCRLDLTGTSLFKDGSLIYLVIQASIAGLRNSNRLISQYFTTGVPKLEIVLNRFEHRTLGVAEDQITKALTRPAQWKIPNDYAAVRRMQTTAVPLALEDSAISRLIRQMARSACGLPPVQEKRSGFSLKSLSRSLSSKISTPDETTALTQLGLVQDAENEAVTDKVRSDPREDRDVPARYERTVTEEAAQEPLRPVESEKPAPTPSVSAPIRQGGLETRSYKGATYVKGLDGEWHLQQDAPKAAERFQPEIMAKIERAAPKAIERFQPEIKATVERAVPKAVERETPVIAWSTPAPIAYGTALSTKQLRAMASVPGSFTYTPSVGEVLPAGVHTLTVDFTPADEAGYTAAEATVLLTVTKAEPRVTWPTPAPVVYGTPLGAAQLNATASVPGRFVYTPTAGEVLSVGIQTLTATFTPADTAGCTTVETRVSFTVTKAESSITWQKPAPIVYGTPLGAAQLNATASVPGRFVYTPAAGEVLSAGIHTLTAAFTPSESTDYASAEAKVQFTVTKATPSLTWRKPAPIAYGTALSAAQLNATASVPGKFVYIPPVGAVLSAGTHTPSVIFTPTDSTNYTAVQAAVPLTVTKSASIINWPAPAPIAYGTALSAEQLNATASVPGRFVYTPGAGEVLAAGTHTLSVTFTPADINDCSAVQATVSLTVAKAKPSAINWPTPASISYGTALNSTQLNATAPIQGKFAYAPDAGEVLAAGTHTLSVTFTPADANIPETQASVQLIVEKAMPAIKWPEPAEISYGTALRSTQLNATALSPGSFVYSPAAGEVLAAGTHTLSVTFTPKNTANEASARATVTLSVAKARPIITWAEPEAIAYGSPLGPAQLNASALVQGAFVYTPAAGTVLASGKQTLSVTFAPDDKVNYTTAQGSVSLLVEGLPNLDSLMPTGDEGNADSVSPESTKEEALQGGSIPIQQSKIETRTYKGATYEKGADGQWYLQKK
jgi:Flp pilus assembly CpaE family ATPase